MIESKQNPKIKSLVKLRERKQRDEAQLFLVEGYRELKRALNSAFTVEALYYCPELYRSSDFEDLIEASKKTGTVLYQVSRSIFEKISYRDGPDGLLAVAQQSTHALSATPLSPNPLIVVVEAIEKPGNLGAIMRSADSAGADALICCDCVIDIYNPNVIRASQGAFFSLPLFLSDSAAAVEFLRAHKINPITTTPGTDQLYWDVSFAGPTALIMGSEKEGLSEFWLGQNTPQVKIPQTGISDSLNVSVATSLVLYEALRQRRSRI